jgi:hypothetical protein
MMYRRAASNFLVVFKYFINPPQLMRTLLPSLAVPELPANIHPPRHRSSRPAVL